MGLLERFGSKRLGLGALLAAMLGVALAPSPAQAWWAHPGWGWHGGWGWRGGVFIGGPRVVIGAPVVAAPVYAPPVVYAAPAYRWVPGHTTPWGAYVPPHWGYR